MHRAVTCCFSGHRPARLPWGEDESDLRCLALKARLRDRLQGAYDRGYRHFLCGMAQGADLYFGEAVLALQEAHPEVTLEAAVPYAGQADHWPAADRDRRQRILAGCSFETVLQHSYTAGCLIRRNRYMVDHASLLLAAYDGTPQGGTMYTIAYALRQGVDVSILEVE